MAGTKGMKWTRGEDKKIRCNLRLRESKLALIKEMAIKDGKSIAKFMEETIEDKAK